MAERLRADEHPWPEMAAALLAARGRLGLDRVDFAVVLGIEVSVVAGVEDGTATEAEIDRWTQRPVSGPRSDNRRT